MLELIESKVKTVCTASGMADGAWAFRTKTQVGNWGLSFPGSGIVEGERITRDHLGSIREVVDATGNLESKFDYSPYGGVQQVSGTFAPDWGFQGMQVLKVGSKTMNLTWGRLYDPSLGSFLGRDPIREAGGINMYSAFGNDPINYVDPLGLARFEYDGQGLHVHDGDLTYMINPQNTGDAVFSPKKSHEKEFNLIKARESFNKIRSNKKEFQKLKDAVSSYYENCADKDGVARTGRNLRRLPKILIVLTILGIGMSADSKAESFRIALHEYSEALQSGRPGELEIAAAQMANELNAIAEYSGHYTLPTLLDPYGSDK